MCTRALGGCHHEVALGVEHLALRPQTIEAGGFTFALSFREHVTQLAKAIAGQCQFSLSGLRCHKLGVRKA